MSVDTLDRAPTVADAQRVADEFALDPNVVRVLLYGSVAKGEQHEFSDIDLVVVYQNLDYSQRHQTDRDLDTVGKLLVGYPVQVFATDIPEWSMRTGLRNSFESGLCSQPMQTLHERPCRGEAIDWNKEQPMPTDELTEAVEFLDDSLTSRLRALAAEVSPPDFIKEHIRGSEKERLSQMRDTVAAAVLTIEMALKAFAKLALGGALDEDKIVNAGHRIDHCLKLLGEPYQEKFTAGLRNLELDPETLGSWRTHVYPKRKKARKALPPLNAERNIDGAIMSALSISDMVLDEFEGRVDPEQTTSAAVALSDAVLDTFEAAAPNADIVAQARKNWTLAKGAYETTDVHTFETRTTPIDLTPMFEGTKQQKRDAFAAGLGERFDELVRTPGVGVQDKTLRDSARDYRRQGRKVKWIAKKLDKSPSWVSDHTSDVVPPTQRRRRKR